MEFKWMRAVGRHGDDRRSVRLGIFTAAVGVVVLLAVAPKPWMFSFPEGQRIRVEDYAAVYLWWAGAVNLAGLLILAATAGWWTKPMGKNDQPTAGSAFRSPRWFWPVVGAAMVAAAAVNAPRLGHGLWDDEEYSLRRFILGSYRTTSTGELKLKEVPWTHTFWYYGKPNNHFVNSLAGRMSNSLWRSLTRPAGLQFSEVALRFPAFVAGVLSVGAWALLLRALGFPSAGALTAWLVMLHPWHMRFVPELRGYSFVFLFLPLACLAAFHAVRTGSWKAWAASGAAQFALFYSWPGTTVALAVLNAGILAMIAAARPENRIVLAARWLVTTSVAGMASFQLYLPCVAQLFGHLDDWDAKGLGLPWVQNVASRLLTGMPWSVPGEAFPEVANLVARNPSLFWTFLAVLIVGIFWGFLRCAMAGSAGLVAAVVFLLPGPMTYILARLKDTYLFEWYLVFMAPGLMALAALGWAGLSGAFPARYRIVPMAGAVLLAATFAFCTHPARRSLIASPVQFTREAVLLTRPTLDPHDPRNDRILTVAILATPEVYDPNIHRIKSRDELTALLRNADATGRPLFVNHGYAHMLAHEIPDLAALISRSDLFEKFATLPGMEPMFDREILRYRPGSLTETR